ncbi:MAG: DNA-binding response regulator [Pseudomonadota bacterium]
MSNPAVQDSATVLVVDDTIESVRFLIDTIESAGMTALVATSAEQAFDLLDRVTPDIVLMDAVMPHMDGFEATRKLKARPDLAHIPVIFMTGLSEPEHVIAALDAGGVDYVKKPLVIEELLARLHVHVANARDTHISKTALDASRQYLIAVDESGIITWATPQAEALIKQGAPDWRGVGASAPPALRGPLARLIAGDAADGASQKLLMDTKEVVVTHLGKETQGQSYVRLEELSEERDVERLRERHGLTKREGEVLLWVSYGKTNRGISDILDISPRTVNKHLEQVFEKLGVETRAAAAAAAVRTILE